MTISRLAMQFIPFKAHIPCIYEVDVLNHLHDLGYEIYVDRDYNWNASSLYIYTDETQASIISLYRHNDTNPWLYSLIPYEEYDYKAILEWRRSDDMRKLLCCH